MKEQVFPLVFHLAFHLLLTANMSTDTLKSRLDIIEDTLPCKASDAVLLVLLPGAYDKPHDFVQHGFVDALRERNIAADIIIADTHIAYYTDELVVERLHSDIIAPARKKGYAQIWLVGISLGGYGALLYARQYAADISGMFLMAPFLGNRSLLAEIEKIGLPAWQPGGINEKDGDRRLWSWIRAYSDCHHTALPQLHIAYGTEDRFIDSNKMLATFLPQQQVMTTEGGHEWMAWRRLWVTFLDGKTLPRLR